MKKTHHLNIRIEHDHYRTLQQLSQQNQVNTSETIRSLLREAKNSLQ